jgi:SpoVK/Ycf46/Vps4 family AAA+-type ATPase
MDTSDSIIVAATNFRSMLDRALNRRFDSVLTYDLPSRADAIELLRAKLAIFDATSVNWNEAAEAATGLSHADIAQAVEQAAKDAVLDGSRAIQQVAILAALQERHSQRG